VRMIRRTLAASATLLFAFSFLSAGPPKPETIQWRSDPESAIAAAKESRKALMIEFTADWCHFCRKLERETLSDSKVVAAVNRCYVAVKLDGDEYGEVVSALGFAGLPAILLVDPQTRHAKRIVGFRTPGQLLNDLQIFCPAEDAGKATSNSSEEPPGRARVHALPPE